MKLEVIEEAMMDVLTEIKEALNLDSSIHVEFCPGETISSDALVTAIGRLSTRLGISIPEKCYPFFDRDNHKQLSIKEAAKKIFYLVKDGE